MLNQKWVSILIIVAAVVFLGATVVQAAQAPGDIFDKANSAIGTIQTIAGLLVATGLYLKLPKGAQSIVNGALKVPPDFAQQLKEKLSTQEARGLTIESYVIKMAHKNGIPLTPDAVHALVVVLTPLAKKIRLRVP